MTGEVIREVINELKKYTVGKKNTQKTEISVLALNRLIFALEEQEPKTGHWKAKSFHELFCDNCGFDFDIMRNDFIDKMRYCPNCGCRMVEPQERSDKE